MNVTLQFPPDLESRLQRVADDRDMTKQEIVALAVHEFIQRASEEDRFRQSIERTLERDSELLERLKDA